MKSGTVRETRLRVRNGIFAVGDGRANQICNSAFKKFPVPAAHRVWGFAAAQEKFEGIPAELDLEARTFLPPGQIDPFPVTVMLIDEITFGELKLPTICRWGRSFARSATTSTPRPSRIRPPMDSAACA